MRSSIITGISKIILLFLFLVHNGCIKENFDPSDFDPSLNLTPGLAIPVGFSRLGFEKYLSEEPFNGILRISDDGFLSLHYSASIDSGVMGDLVSFPDASSNESITNNSGSVIFVNIPGSSVTITDSIIIPVTGSYAGTRIDSIKLMAGTIDVNITSADITGTITFQSDGFRQNGQPLSITRNLSNPDFTLSLANYSVIPEHDMSGSNLLKCTLSIRLQYPSGPVNAGAVLLDIFTDLTGMSYETIYGDFGGYSIDFPSRTFSTPFFGQIIEGQILFADPKLKLKFLNSAGVPFGISFSEIYAIDRNNMHHPLTGPGIPTAASPKIIKYPSLIQEGLTVTDSLIIDRNNSNLPDFIAASPDSVTIKGAASIISLTPPATTFVRYDSRYTVSSEFELPLWGKANLMVLLDTMPFDYLGSTLPPPEELEKLIVRTSITNSFPVTAKPQIYLLDANYMLLDSLFTGSEKIEGASDTNGDGKADPQKQPPVDIDLPRSKIDNLLNTRYLLAKASITTTDFPSVDVRLYSSYFLDYNVGLIAKLKIKTGN